MTEPATDNRDFSPGQEYWIAGRNKDRMMTTATEDQAISLFRWANAGRYPEMLHKVQATECHRYHNGLRVPWYYNEKGSRRARSD